MKKLELQEVQVGKKVYYIPDHLENTPGNAESGVVTTVSEDGIWVRYRGPQGNLTPLKNLYE